MRRQRGKQQLATDIQAIAAEDARQRFNRQIIQRILAPVLFCIERGLFFQATVIQPTAARAVDFAQRRIFRQHLLGAAYAAAVLANHENINTGRQQRKQVHQLKLRFRFVLWPVVNQRIAIGDIAGLCDQAIAGIFAHLAAQYLPVVELLGMGAAGGRVQTCGQVILQVTGKQNAGGLEIITVAQQDFTCRGKSGHETLLH